MMGDDPHAVAAVIRAAARAPAPAPVAVLAGAAPYEMHREGAVRQS
jgi:hypothetical protein